MQARQMAEKTEFGLRSPPIFIPGVENLVVADLIFFVYTEYVALKYFCAG